MSDAQTCPKCQNQIHPVLEGADHSVNICQFRERQANLKDEEYVSVGEDDDVREMIQAGFLPVMVFKWPVNADAPQQGYIKSIHLPKWLLNSCHQYHHFKWEQHMTLTEFLEKMHK